MHVDTHTLPVKDYRLVYHWSPYPEMRQMHHDEDDSVSLLEHATQTRTHSYNRTTAGELMYPIKDN